MKTIDELIKEGEEFGLQIKKKQEMSTGTISIVSPVRYFVPNEQLYYNWKTASYILLKQNYESEFATEFKQLADLKMTPQNHVKMLSILYGLQSMTPVTSTYSKCELEIMDVEKLREDYEKEYKFSVSSATSVSAFHKWYSKAIVLFKHYVPVDDSDFKKFVAFNTDSFNIESQYYSVHSTYHVLLDKLKRVYCEEVRHDKYAYGNKVFIVHGHNDAMKLEVARVLEKLGLEAIILHEQANRGRTIIEKLENNSSDVGFAVILLTADDDGKAKIDNILKSRARQNVVFEMGLFMALLKRERVMLLLSAGVEEPSDLNGMVYTPIDAAGAWKYALCDELKSAGYDVSKDKI